MEHLIGSDLNLSIDLDNGARISSVQWRENEFVIPPRNITGWGWFAMAPWAGRVKDGLLKTNSGMVSLPTHISPPHAIHGLGLDTSWEEIANDSRGRQVSRLILPDPYKGAVVEQTVELLDNSIRWSLEYDANGVDLPAWLGFHPWFAREINGSFAEIEFNPGQMMQHDGDKIPTGKLIKPTPAPWDGVFTQVSGVPTIRWPGVASITVESDAPWWIIYDADPVGVCVEPWTAPPDAANLGITGDHYLEALFTFNVDYGD